MAEFKRVWLKYEVRDHVKRSGTRVVVDFTPIDCEESKKADAEIQNLITQGWKIVSTAPVIKSYNLLMDGGHDIYVNFTSGIEVFMTREKLSKI